MMKAANTSETEDYAQLLVNSLERFTRAMYYVRTGRKFLIPEPPGRQNHISIICEALMKVFRGETKRLIINVPPRYGKTELLIHFIAWALAQYPDSNFIYVSYSHTLAKKQTETIREIISLMEFQELYGLGIDPSSGAKDNFKLVSKNPREKAGGAVYAVGSGGTVTGLGAGLQNVIGRFTGAIIIDDIIKPDEAASDVVREGINEWYYNTLQSRTNSPTTPIIIIGQRTNEEDLSGKHLNNSDWERIIIPAIDEAGNALNPAMHDIHTLRKMQQENPYVFSAQYQQNPVDNSSALFKKEWFVLKNEPPELLSLFITADTAESLAAAADSTVFSLFGVHKLLFREEHIEDMYGLYWVDCWEMKIEPKDLQNAFMDFWAQGLRYKQNGKSVPLKFAAIEKKSTGATLLSILTQTQGLQTIDIERKGRGSNKAERFLEMQQYVASKQISLPEYGKHTKMCIDHMSKITGNMVHRHDDICDSLGDAIRVALRDKVIINRDGAKTDHNAIARSFSSAVNKTDRLKKAAYGR